MRIFVVFKKRRELFTLRGLFTKRMLANLKESKISLVGSLP